MLAIRLETPNSTSSGSGASNLIDATDVLYGLSTSGTAAANATALGLADAAAVAAGKQLWIPKGTYATTGVTFSSFVVMGTGAIFSASSGILAFNGGVDWDISPHLTLTGTALATFNNNKTLVGYAEWWGAVPNDAGIDSTAAINYALTQPLKVQLMVGTYYISYGLQHYNHYCFLAGAPRQLYYSSVAATLIMCSSATVTILDWSGGARTEDIMFDRSIGPNKASGCIGVWLNPYTNPTYVPVMRNVVSNNSMVSFKFHKIGFGTIEHLHAYRNLAGTGGGSDTYIGLFFDGTLDLGLTVGGNPSFYLDHSRVLAGGTFTGTSTGYLSSTNFTDTFLNRIEGEGLTYGLHISGNSNNSAMSCHNYDYHVYHPILEAKYPIYIENLDKSGGVTIHGGYVLPNVTGGAAVTVLSSAAAVSINDVQKVMLATAVPAIYIFNSSNVESSGQIIECSNYLVKLESSSNCSISDIATNNYNNGAGVTLINSNRNRLNMGITGAKTKIGYLADSTSGYNEFNCTGIDPAGITGGAANKLVINGTQVVVVGIAAAGTGNNVASGVMA